MIKDKIIELENGTNYYILDDIAYKEKKYVLAAECDSKNDSINENKYIVMELKINNNELFIVNIEDDNIANIVTRLLIEKVRK